MIISLARQFVFVVPVAYVFCQLAKMNSEWTWSIWTTFIIAEVITFLIALFLMKKISKQINALP